MQLVNAGKLYGLHWAVRGVTLTVEPGELFTLLGPSGCGKTTLLRIIAGLVEPDVGSVYLDGRSMAGVPPWKRDVGLVFQRYALWPHLDVFEHVAFGLREREVAPEQVPTQVTETLQMVGLGTLQGCRPSQLSRSQQQRVALARTLALRPRVLLLDEPLSDLDAAQRAQMRVELRRLHHELGATTVYATNDQEDAMALSTRVAVLERGTVLQVGPPAEVYRRPRTRFVGEFLGAANVLPGRLESTQSGRVVKLNDGLTLTIDGSELDDGTLVTCLLRPESIQRAAAEARHPNRIYATLTAAVYLGGRWDCELSLAGGLTLRAAMPAGAGPAPKVGEVLTVIVPPEDVIVVAG